MLKRLLEIEQEIHEVSKDYNNVHIIESLDGSVKAHLIVFGHYEIQAETPQRYGVEFSRVGLVSADGASDAELRALGDDRREPRTVDENVALDPLAAFAHQCCDIAGPIERDVDHLRRLGRQGSGTYAGLARGLGHFGDSRRSGGSGGGPDGGTLAGARGRAFGKAAQRAAAFAAQGGACRR